MSEQASRFTTPVGRLVSGSAGDLQKRIDPVTKQPKLDKTTNQETFEYFIGVAIPKDGSGHWANTEWGKIIWAAGFAGFAGNPALVQAPGFAWKIIDGDSRVPNKAGKIPGDNPNLVGHWVLQFRSSFSPQLWNRDGTQAIAASEIYRGSYVQISSTVKGNGIVANAGVYLNHDMIALAGHGEPILSGPDVSVAGFGGAALPPGASATPVASFSASNVPAPAPVQQAPAPAPAPMQAAPAPAQAHTQILTPPAPPA